MEAQNEDDIWVSDGTDIGTTVLKDPIISSKEHPIP